MDARKLAGREAEARCAEYLRARGYKILAMNYACRGGEIDIVAAKGAYLAFVEVKERANRRFGEAREADYGIARMTRICSRASTWRRYTPARASRKSTI